MPGVFGIFDKKYGQDRQRKALCLELLEAMASAMQYEKFYVGRQEVFEDLGAYVGWSGPSARLAHTILDRRDGLSLLISGEPLCEAATESRGEESQSLNILDQYLHVGDCFVDQISGSFSGILIDRRGRQWFVFNDHFGVERLFYFEDNEWVAFSNEAKAILAAFPETRTFDPEGASQFFACGYTFDSHSLYRGISVLPGGSIAKFTGKKKPTVRSYIHQTTSAEGEPLTERQFVAGFSERLKAVLGRYLSLYSRAGVSLTGGLDTRMIMACLNTPEDTVPCYTFGSMYRETFDIRAARCIASLCRQPYKVFVLGQEFLSSFGQYLRKSVLVSDGYLGFSGAAELYLNALASAQAPLRITGNYGGELLRGAGAFNCVIPEGDFLRPEMEHHAKGTARFFHQMRQMKPLSFTLALQAAAGFGRYTIERSQVSQVTPFLDKDLVEMACRKTNQPGFLGDPSVHVIKWCYPDLLRVPTDRGLLGGGGQVGRSGRRLYREALFRLEYWTGEGMPDWLARISGTGLGALSERLFTGRHKFQHFRTWLRRDLASVVRESLEECSASPLAEYIEFSNVGRMIDDHVIGKRNYFEGVDRITTLALAQRLLLQGQVLQSKRDGSSDRRSRAK